MLILLIDNENICTDTNFIDPKKYCYFFLYIVIYIFILLGNVLILCIFFCKITEKSLAYFFFLNNKIKTDYSFFNLVVFSV